MTLHVLNIDLYHGYIMLIHYMTLHELNINLYHGLL